MIKYLICELFSETYKMESFATMLKMPQAVTLIFVAKRSIIDVYGSPGFTTVTLHLLKCAKIQNRNIGYILFVLSSFCSF